MNIQSGCQKRIGRSDKERWVTDERQRKVRKIPAQSKLVSPRKAKGKRSVADFYGSKEEEEGNSISRILE